MKRVFVLLLALGLLFSLAACGEPEPTGTKKPNNEKPGTTQSTGPVAMKTIYVITGSSTTQIVDGTITYESKQFFSYDDQGRMIRYTFEVDGNSMDSVEMEIQCDEYGRTAQLRSIQDGKEVTITYAYDEMGNRLSQITAQDGNTLQSLHYTYDADGNLLSRELEVSGICERVEYVYEQGRLVKEISYRDGELSQYELYYYDDQGRVIKSETRMPNDSVYSTWDYTYSEDGLTTYSTCEKYKLSTVTVRDAHGNVIRTEQIDVGGSSVTEYTYIAIEIPEDTPRQSEKIQGV